MKSDALTGGTFAGSKGDTIDFDGDDPQIARPLTGSASRIVICLIVVPFFISLLASSTWGGEAACGACNIRHAKEEEAGR